VRRHRLAYLDALGAQRIPRPHHEGDFCRRFNTDDVEQLMDILSGPRAGLEAAVRCVFEEAFITPDGNPGADRLVGVRRGGTIAYRLAA